MGPWLPKISPPADVSGQSALLLAPPATSGAPCCSLILSTCHRLLLCPLCFPCAHRSSLLGLTDGNPNQSIVCPARLQVPGARGRVLHPLHSSPVPDTDLHVSLLARGKGGTWNILLPFQCCGSPLPWTTTVGVFQDGPQCPVPPAQVTPLVNPLGSRL